MLSHNRPDGRPVAMRPLLDAPEPVVAGYVALDREEAHFTRIALRELPDLVACWYRFLTLFERALRREHDISRVHDAGEEARLIRSWHLRLRLASVAAGTSKMALDGALAGRYAQCFALVRHLLETWQQMNYAAFYPEEATRWFLSSAGTPPREPNAGTILRGLRRAASNDREFLAALSVVERLVTNMAKGAHPSGLAVDQIHDPEPGHNRLAATFNRARCVHMLDNGTLASFLILRELRRDVPLDEDWLAELQAVMDARTEAIDAYRRAPL